MPKCKTCGLTVPSVDDHRMCAICVDNALRNTNQPFDVLDIHTGKTTRVSVDYVNYYLEVLYVALQPERHNM